MSNNYFKNGVNEILKKVLNGKRTIREAFNYLEENFTGETRKAFNWKCYLATSTDQTNAMTVYNLLHDAIKLGHGKDYNFESVYR